MTPRVPRVRSEYNVTVNKDINVHFYKDFMSHYKGLQ